MREEVWFFTSVAIALLASIYALAIIARTFLILDLKGKELEQTVARINQIVSVRVELVSLSGKLIARRQYLLPPCQVI